MTRNLSGKLPRFPPGPSRQLPAAQVPHISRDFVYRPCASALYLKNFLTVSVLMWYTRRVKKVVRSSYLTGIHSQFWKFVDSSPERAGSARVARP
jgi:hypothetical protein